MLGSELQLIEMIHNNPWTRNPFFWTANHYGYSYHTSGNARWYYTVYTADIQRFSYGLEWSPRGYIIWHKVNGSDWRKVSTQNFHASGQRGSSHQCRAQTSGQPATIANGSGRMTSGVIQCGINHVAHSIYFSPPDPAYQHYYGNAFNHYWCRRYYGVIGTGEAATGSIPQDSVCKSIDNAQSIARNQYPASELRIAERFIGYEQIRIYQPRNRYQDLAPLHQ